MVKNTDFVNKSALDLNDGSNESTSFMTLGLGTSYAVPATIYCCPSNRANVYYMSTVWVCGVDKTAKIY